MILIFMAAFLLLLFGWQSWIAIGFLNSAIENVLGSIVQWRLLEQFVVWPALLVLILVSNVENPGSMLGKITPVLWGIGIAAVAVNAAWSQANGREIVEVNVAVWMALTAGVLAVQQFLGIARRGGSLNIEQLWRFIALQWALLVAGSEFYFRWHYRQEGIAASENARATLFLLPALAVLPNVMMPVGIRLWAAGQVEMSKPRPRAWLMARAFLNVGAVMALVKPSLLFFVGGPLMVLSFVLYVMGFSGRSLRRGFVWVALTGLFYVAGLVLLYLERVKLAMSPDPPSLFYSESWRSLMMGGFLVWLIAAGFFALESFVPRKIRPRVAGQIAALMFGVGTAHVAVVLFAAAFDHRILQGLFAGTLMQLIAALVGLAAMLRSVRYLRPAAEAAA